MTQSSTNLLNPGADRRGPSSSRAPRIRGSGALTLAVPSEMQSGLTIWDGRLVAPPINPDPRVCQSVATQESGAKLASSVLCMHQ